MAGTPVLTARGAQTGDDGYGDTGGDHAQREPDRHFVDVEQQHLDADEDEDGGEAGLEVDEAVDQVGQQEVHRPQAQDRERVAGENQERILGHGEDRGDGVDGEDDVGGLDHDQNEEQRGSGP